jgi:putative addiction module killer protein
MVVARQITIELYEDQEGQCPYEKWIAKLKNKLDVAKIENRIRRIEIDGHFGTMKPLKNDIFELKFYFGPGYRVYFGQSDNKVVILLIGGDKSSQKRDIEKATLYWKDYLERKDA